MNLDHAVVIGGSVAGLLAAKALSESFDRVTIYERDAIPEGPVGRKGVPQGRQIHGMLPIGMDMIEELLPGFTSDLTGAGAPRFDLSTIAHFGPDGWQLRKPCGYFANGATRPLMEWVMRRHVADVDNVEVIQAVVGGLLASDDGADVVGVRLNDGTELPAQLVVDASGRGSRAPRWFEELGYEPPHEMHVRVYMGYASQLVTFPEGALPNEPFVFVALPFPGHIRGGALLPQENGTYILTASGMMKDYPPSEREAFLDFMDDAPTPVFSQIARLSQPVGEIHTYRMPGNQRRVWEDLERRPGGFLVVGDGIASFNPVYGQGMTSAANAAVNLRDAVRDSGGDMQSLPAAFHERLRTFMDLAFKQSAGPDAYYDGAELEGTEPPYPEDEAAYVDHVAAMATEDEVALTAILEGFYSMREEQLFTDEVKAKVEEWVSSGRSVSNNDPAALPPLLGGEPALR